MACVALDKFGKLFVMRFTRCLGDVGSVGSSGEDQGDCD